MSVSARLVGLGTAVPRFHGSQKVAARFMRRVLEAAPESRPRDRGLRLVERVYPQSRIDERHSVLDDFLAHEARDLRFFPQRWDLEPFPTTAARMRVYEAEAPALAELAARRALEDAGVAASDVTHLVISTCTGLVAPGPDVELVTRLGLRPSVARAQVGFMGCYAGLTALRVAAEAARATPDAVVLVVAVELSTIHFQKDPQPELIVANCLFGDGAGAAVVSSDPDIAPRAALAAHHTRLGDATRDQMSWRIGDTGFEMRLAARVPPSIGEAAGPFVAELAARAGHDEARTAHWAIHPGGWPIVEAVGEALGLDERALEPSLEVLRRHGNMSSATIFFVLEQLLGERGVAGPIVALAFGPGLTLEGALLHATPRPT